MLSYVIVAVWSESLNAIGISNVIKFLINIRVSAFEVSNQVAFPVFLLFLIYVVGVRQGLSKEMVTAEKVDRTNRNPTETYCVYNLILVPTPH